LRDKQGSSTMTMFSSFSTLGSIKNIYILAVNS